MKLLKFILFAFVLFILSLYSISLSWNAWGKPNEKLYTNDRGNAVSMSDNSLEGGADQTSLGIEGVSTSLTGDDAKSPIDYVSRWINYFIGILAIIILFLLVYNGIVMITAGGDEEKYSTGLKNLRNYAIGLIFIGLSWLFVMLIFYVIENKF